MKKTDICFVFMNPTGKNIASDKTWKGRKSPWLGTKNIWKLFHNVNLLSEDVFNEIQRKKPKDWDYEFCEYVYEEITNNKLIKISPETISLSKNLSKLSNLNEEGK